jgi:hypothetical protein
MVQADDIPDRVSAIAGELKLAEACKSGRCPICFLLKGDEFKELCQWVGGSVADENNRRRLDEAGGFCNYHFWLLCEIHSPQSGSVVNEYIAAKLLDSLRKESNGGGQIRAQWLRIAAEKCPLCIHLANCEAQHVHAFVTWLEQPPSWGRYENSRGLCLPHLLLCQPLLGNKSLRRRLDHFQAAQFGHLQLEMRELVRKFESGQRWEITPDEWFACKRVVEKLVGRKGAPFPHDLPANPFEHDSD